MVRLGFLLLILAFTVSCNSLPESTPVNPDQSELDSLLAIYGEAIATENLTYLKHFDLDQKGNTLLYGGTADQFWFGAFRPDRTLIKENLVMLDSESRFIRPKTVASNLTLRVMDKLLFEAFTNETDANTSNTSIARSTLGLSESTYELYHVTDYIHEDDYIYIQTARPWKSGYLLEMNGSLGRSGKNYTQYISRDFTESVIWDCRSPQSPRIGVYYFEVDFFLDVLANGVSGFDYSTCKKWGYNTLDFFGKTTCPSCQTSLLLKQHIGPEITLEAKLDAEVRRIVIEYRTGRIVSNEEV